MFLQITTTHRPATDLGYLLHKNPARRHEIALSFGTAHVFYPEASDERCTASLLVEVDPVGLVRGRGGPESGEGLLAQYVNDRPYVASSFLSVAIGRAFGTALGGRCAQRPELAQTAIPLEARLAPLPARGGAALIERLFAPLGFSVAASGHAVDDTQPDWGASPYFTVALAGTSTLARLLSALYVLVPVLDDDKHYFVGEDEIDNLLRKGEGWLAGHPERELIAYRYLKRRKSLAREALARLAEDAPPAEEEQGAPAAEEALEEPIRLNDLRIAAVLGAIKDGGAARVLDLGCGQGRLLRELMRERQFEAITGLDVSSRMLEIAAERLNLERLPPKQRARLTLLHGALTYRDRRLDGYDAAALVEVIEHLDPHRLEALEAALFSGARPRAVVVTTPNVEYNALFPNLPAGARRHADHRFEWTRAEFAAWCAGVATRHGYAFRIDGIGEAHALHGQPTQMAVFTLCS